MSLNISQENEDWFHSTAKSQGIDYTSYIRRMFGMMQTIEAKRADGYELAFVKDGNVEVVHFI